MIRFDRCGCFSISPQGSARSCVAPLLFALNSAEGYLLSSDALRVIGLALLRLVENDALKLFFFIEESETYKNASRSSPMRQTPTACQAARAITFLCRCCHTMP